MDERVAIPTSADSTDADELSPNEQGRRKFISQMLGGSLMLMALPTLASTLFKPGMSEAEKQRIKQESIGLLANGNRKMINHLFERLHRLIKGGA